SPAEFQRLLDELEKLLREQGIELSELARALLQQDSGRLERLLREAAKQARVDRIERSFQEGQYAQGMQQALGMGDLAREMQALAEKSFYYLSEDEIRRMKEAVTKLAQRLKNVLAVKRRHARRGKFDVKATLRRNLQYGGVPFKIQFDERKRVKPQVVVLCDVSDSVRNVSRFMLQFVYSLQDLYSKVRSFIFVADVGEITKLFEENEIHQAIDQAIRGNVINVYAHSDFG